MRKPIRTCAACGKKAEKSTLLRFSRSPDGQIGTFSFGRGAYTCPNSQCIDKLAKSKSLAHRLRLQGAKMPQEIIKELMEKVNQINA